MKEFQFKALTKLTCGAGASAEIGTLCQSLGGKKVCLLSDEVVSHLPIMEVVEDSLERSGLRVCVNTDSQVDPEVEGVDEIADRVKAFQPDLIAALGGGSVIDTAKAVCVLQTNEGSSADYMFGGTRSIEHPLPPLVCVPTTAGSGSEVTGASVLTDSGKHRKASISHEFLIPKAAILDPLATVDCPGELTASTGADALTHAIEAYVSKNANPFSDALALSAIRLIGTHLEQAVRDGQDQEARSGMGIAASLAGLAFLNGGLGAVHGITQSMGAAAHVAHGISNAIMLPHVMKKNQTGNPRRFREVAEALGGQAEGVSDSEGAKLAVELVTELLERIGIPKKISAIGVTEEMFPEIVRGTMEYRMLAYNPLALNEEDVLEILRWAM